MRCFFFRRLCAFLPTPGRRFFSLPFGRACQRFCPLLVVSTSPVRSHNFFPYGTMHLFFLIRAMFCLRRSPQRSQRLTFRGPPEQFFFFFLSPRRRLHILYATIRILLSPEGRFQSIGKVPIFGFFLPFRGFARFVF